MAEEGGNKNNQQIVQQLCPNTFSVAMATVVCFLALKRACGGGPSLRDRRIRKLVLESNRIRAEEEREELKEQLKAKREAHPALGGLAAAEDAASEEEARKIEKNVAVEMAEKLEALKKANAESCAEQAARRKYLGDLRAKVNAADTVKGEAAMAEELKKEVEALDECDISAAMISGKDFGVVELCKHMSLQYDNQREVDDNQRKELKHECDRLAKTAPQGFPCEMISKEEMEQRMADVRIEMHNEAGQLKAFNEEVSKKEAEAKARRRKAECTNNELRAKLEAERAAHKEAEKMYATELAKLNDYVREAPALYRSIDENKRAWKKAEERLEEANRQKLILIDRISEIEAGTEFELGQKRHR